MGACYDVELKLKPKDENQLKQMMNEFINESEHIIFDLENKDRNNLEDLVKIFITDRGFYFDGKVYSTSFDACYGWEAVMTDSFEYYSKALKDGSYIKIWPDNGCEKLTVRNGEVVWS